MLFVLFQSETQKLQLHPSAFVGIWSLIVDLLYKQTKNEILECWALFNTPLIYLTENKVIDVIRFLVKPYKDLINKMQLTSIFKYEYDNRN